MAGNEMRGKLPAADFKRLKECIKYGNRRLSNVLDVFRHDSDKPDLRKLLTMEQFEVFMNSYLGESISQEIVQNLFLSFCKEVSRAETDGMSLEGTINTIEGSEVLCYLSLLENTFPHEKFEFAFSIYDTDDNNYLDQEELELIMKQMINVAEHLEWDTTSLKPILSDMLADMDRDADGKISRNEWRKNGMDNITLLVLLGINVQTDEDKCHQWTMRQFTKRAYCNICRYQLDHKQGLQCLFCRYTCHERCVAGASNKTCIDIFRPTNCPWMYCHWIDGNCNGPCISCRKKIKNDRLRGLNCVWCHKQVHDRCRSNLPREPCDYGVHRIHMLPPVCIIPETGKSEEDIRARRENTLKVSSIQPLPESRPLIVFINPKSGGRQGDHLLSEFFYLLHPRQVYNLAESGPAPALEFFAQVDSFRVLCCGGDGTAGWVLSTIDKMSNLRKRPPVAILPLGTGNDLSRTLGWGGGYEGESIDKILQCVANSEEVLLDRWEIDCKRSDSTEDGDDIPQNIINNYFSIGCDASVALKFHLQREKHPEKFNNRFKNKLRYFEAGASETLAASCKNLQQNIKIICDGKKLDLPTLEGIVILNIPSVYGGADIWGKSSDPAFGEQDISDGKLEVVGLEGSFHVGQIIAGLRPHGLRLSQCEKITIRTTKVLPMQVDGEPWMQAPAEITISHKNQSVMCVAPRQHERTCLFGCFG